MRTALEMNVVKRRALLHDLVDAGRERVEPYWPRGRTGRGSPAVLRGAGALLREPGEVPPAERALARAHRRGRVALQDLRGVPSLLPCLVEIGDGDVLADADVSGDRRPTPRLVQTSDVG